MTTSTSGGKSAAKQAKPAQQVGEEIVRLDGLNPHPRNYKHHPESQLVHIQESLRAHGFYRNIVVAQDGTILAGHGVVEAARKMGLETVPVRRLPLDPDSPAALKVLALDNEVGKFAETDDRALTELLKQINAEDATGLLGTGFDEKMLAGLVYNTRPSSELESMDEAGEWVGMPEYDEGKPINKLIIAFESAEAREEFTKAHGMKPANTGLRWSTRWPPAPNEDFEGVRFEAGKAPSDP